MATTVRQVKRQRKNIKTVPAVSATAQLFRTAEVEGYGPYKPVPPPKPLPTSGCHSPPPYRMPPYPLYSEPTIPGAATGTESAYIPSQNNNLHTHSSKFPIEREVILSSTDKNSKIPILNEYRKRPKTAIAPDAPNKQLAWTEEKNKGLDHTLGNHHPHPQDTLPTHQLYKAQPMTLIETSRESEISPINRPQDHINGYASQPSVSTGAVPRTPAHSTPENDSGQNKAFPTRTYHTIKDMISSRFTKQQRSEMVQKQDELSPQSQLRQHGVYLASAQQQSRAMNPGSSAASAEVMRRNQEIRQQIERERRGENDDGGFHEMVNRNYHGGSRHSILDSDTPRRNPNDTPYQSRESETRALAIEMTPGSTRRMDTRTPIQPEIRPGEMYGRMPTSQSIYYQESGGYGIPGTRKSLADAENARRAAETERVRRLDENRSAFQSVNQQPPTPHQRMTVNPELTPRLLNKDDRMQSLGVYVSRNPNEQSQSVNKNPDTRTPEFRHRTDFIDKRSVCQSNERLDIVGDSASAVGVTNSAGSSGAVGHSTNAGVVGHSASASGVGHVENRSEAYQKSKSMSELEEGRAKDDCVRPDLDDDDAGFSKGGASSDYEKLRGGAQSDSGRGSTVYSSGKAKTERQIDTSPEPNTTPGPGDSQWVDIVENELRHILDPKLHHNIANSTLSESISSMTPPLPPLSPGGSSDEMGPAFKHKSLPYGSKPEYSAKSRNSAGPGRGMWSARVNSKDKSAHHRSSNKRDNLQSKLPPTLLCSSLELDSMLDDENNSSDEDLSTTIDTSDTRAIRKQLEGLENMYSEVLKLLGVKKQFGRYQPSDPRINKRRLYGSMSSLPSSVSSRPMRDKRRHDERKKVKDMKGINKRFQRLESHVVTLARSVAHLSSEMRTQHLMMQEMEVIRGELAALRTQSNMAAVRSQSMPRALNRLSVEQSNSNPERVKKLTKFFGDEPPLLRLFLKKLGYEKYASLFENERVGLVELPYMTEERLHKLGIPLGPRLRIMQEAQMGFAAHENTLCIV